jgi:hypothetical protein
MGDLEKYQAVEERLQSMTDATSTLASQMAELLELRERVRQAQSSNEGDGQQPRYKRVARRPGRLFMQNQWMMGRSYYPARISSPFA